MTIVSEKLYQNMISFKPDDFNYAQFSAYMGYPPGKAIPAPVKSVLREKLLPHIQASPLYYQYRMSDIVGRNSRTDDVMLDDLFHLKGNLVYRLLKGCTHVIAHLISISGQVVDDITEIYICNAYFNTILQMAADHLRLILTHDIDIPDIRLTRRYAPGYCGWPIVDQSVLLQLLDPAAIGVRYSDSLMLEPVHSVSGIFGLRQHPRISGRMPCHVCTSLTCRVHDDFSQELIFLKGEKDP